MMFTNEKLYEIIKDTRSLAIIAKELEVNEKTIRRNLKKRGLVRERKITKNSRVPHHCKLCSKGVSRGSERCTSCGNKGKKAWNKGKVLPEIQGEKSPKWKGGRRLTSSGYVEIYSYNHPHKTRNDTVAEHRLVVEKKIGRYLIKSERVHHIDGDKQNNNIKNLMIFKNDKEHIKFHTKIRQFGMTGPILRQIDTRWDNLK